MRGWVGVEGLIILCIDIFKMICISIDMNHRFFDFTTLKRFLFEL